MSAVDVSVVPFIDVLPLCLQVMATGDLGMDLQEAIHQASSDIGLSLKPKQMEAVVKFCLGNDVFVSLPTGYGKSIIYAILPRVFDKTRGR